MVGQHSKIPGDLPSVLLHLPNYQRAERRAERRAIELLSFFGSSLVDRKRRLCVQSLLRRPAAGGDRPRARVRAQDADAGRADRGHE